MQGMEWIQMNSRSAFIVRGGGGGGGSVKVQETSRGVVNS